MAKHDRVGLSVSIEASPKKVFASAVDWPGWSRSGKTEELALEALAAYGERYAVVAGEAGLDVRRPDGRATSRSSTASRVVRARSSACPASSSSWIGGRRRPPTPSDSPISSARRGRSSTGWSPARRPSSGRAARRRAGPRQGRRPCRRVGLGLRARSWGSDPAARPDRPLRREGRTRGDPRAPAPALGWLADRGSPLDRPLRRPAHRLARPRPRLGDRGPLDPGRLIVRPAGSPPSA